MEGENQAPDEIHDEPLRAITLVEQRSATDTIFLGVRLSENGDLVVEGQDIGEIPEQFFGEREYEVERT